MSGWRDDIAREKWLDAATLRQKGKIKTEGEVTRDEWIGAVYYEKYRSYHFYSCGGMDGPWISHRNVLEILKENPRLAESKWGRNYVERTKGIEALFEERAAAEESGGDLVDIDNRIEDVLIAGLGSCTLKYWDPTTWSRKTFDALKKEDQEFILSLGVKVVDDDDEDDD